MHKTSTVIETLLARFEVGHLLAGIRRNGLSLLNGRHRIDGLSKERVLGLHLVLIVELVNLLSVRTHPPHVFGHLFQLVLAHFIDVQRVVLQQRVPPDVPSPRRHTHKVEEAVVHNQLRVPPPRVAVRRVPHRRALEKRVVDINLVFHRIKLKLGGDTIAFIHPLEPDTAYILLPIPRHVRPDTPSTLRLLHALKMNDPFPGNEPIGITVRSEFNLDSELSIRSKVGQSRIPSRSANAQPQLL